MRLADIRVPRGWHVSLIGGLLLARLILSRIETRNEAHGAEAGTDLAATVLKRWEQGDERADAMIALTRTLRALTRALLFVGLVTLVLAVVSLVVALS